VHFVSPRDVENGEYQQHLLDLNQQEQAPLATAMQPHQAGIDAAAARIERRRGAVRAAPRGRKRSARRKLQRALQHHRELTEAAEADPAVHAVRERIRSRELNARHVPIERAKWIKHRASNERALADLGLAGRHQFSTVVGQGGPSPYRTANVAGYGITKVAADHPGDARTRHVVLNQKETTTAIIKAMGPGAVHKDEVIERLRAGLAGHADPHERKWVAAQIRMIRRRVAALRKSSNRPDARLLLINRREGHENTQHNTSDAQFAALTKWYGEKHLRGRGENVHAQATMGVAVGAQPQDGDLDLYDQRNPNPPPSTKRRTALLWARIADLQKEGLVHGLIGGRSGSMDIAAFMGVNAYSWDEEKPDNVDYQRLRKTDPIMTVGHMHGEDHQLDEAHVKGWMKAPASAPAPRRGGPDKRLENLNRAIAQQREALKNAPKRQRAALREQLKNTVENRKRLLAQQPPQ
jgi:hypothetical protein